MYCVLSLFTVSVDGVDCWLAAQEKTGDKLAHGKVKNVEVITLENSFCFYTEVQILSGVAAGF